MYFTHLNLIKYFSFSEQCMSFDHLPPLKTGLKMFRNYCHVQQFIYSHMGVSDAHALNMHTKMQARTHAFTHAHTQTLTRGKNNHNGPLHTWPFIQELCASACLYTLRPGLFSRGGEHSGTCYHVQYSETKQGSRGLSCLRAKCSIYSFSTLNSSVLLVFFSSRLTKTKPFSLLLLHSDSPPWQSHEKKPPLSLSCGEVVAAGCLLPHGSVVVVQLMDFVVVGLSVVLVPHGVLVHGCIGLGGGVVGRRDAVTGLTTVVTVPVIHGTVWILVCSHKDSGREEKVRRREKDRDVLCNLCIVNNSDIFPCFNL